MTLEQIDNIVSICLLDAGNGEYHPLLGLIDWLIDERGFTLRRIVQIAEKRYGVPKHVALATIGDLI